MEYLDINGEITSEFNPVTTIGVKFYDRIICNDPIFIDTLKIKSYLDKINKTDIIHTRSLVVEYVDNMMNDDVRSAYPYCNHDYYIPSIYELLCCKEFISKGILRNYVLFTSSLSTAIPRCESYSGLCVKYDVYNNTNTIINIIDERGYCYAVLPFIKLNKSIN